MRNIKTKYYKFALETVKNMLVSLVYYEYKVKYC